MSSRYQSCKIGVAQFSRGSYYCDCDIDIFTVPTGCTVTDADMLNCGINVLNLIGTARFDCTTCVVGITNAGVGAIVASSVNIQTM